jgi:1-acyl-sn-glycerol-3-phosphate acyltransferase
MPRQRSRAEGWARHTVAWLYCLIYVPLIIVFCVLLPRPWKMRAWPAMVRLWGRTMMRIAGVGLVIDPATQAQLMERRPRVMLFNHTSTLDTFVGAAVLPPGGVLVLKREFLFLPLLGQATWALGSVFVDRANGDRARASLARAVERVKRHQLQLLIAPEGTRVAGPEMGRFKLGAFALARDAGIPTLPVVIHGCHDIWPKGAFAPKSGTVHVTVRPERLIEAEDHAALRVIADATRAEYQAALAAGPGAPSGTGPTL